MGSISKSTIKFEEEDGNDTWPNTEMLSSGSCTEYRNRTSPASQLPGMRRSPICQSSNVPSRYCMKYFKNRSVFDVLYGKKKYPSPEYMKVLSPLLFIFFSVLFIKCINSFVSS